MMDRDRTRLDHYFHGYPGYVIDATIKKKKLHHIYLEDLIKLIIMNTCMLK
jgi:hypothetical protein